MASSNIGVEDMVFHSLFIGATGAGKTNALLYWLERLSRDRRDVALVLIDPHGDAAIDLVRAIPKTERERVTIFDPTYVSFGLNPSRFPRASSSRTGSRCNSLKVQSTIAAWVESNGNSQGRGE